MQDLHHTYAHLSLAVLAVFFAPLAAAGLTEEMLVCRELASASERLACYDGIVDRSVEPAGTGAAQVEASTVPDPPTTENVERSVEPAGTGAAQVEASTVPEPPTTENVDQETRTGLSQEQLFGMNAEEVQQQVEKATGAERLDRIEARITELWKIAPEKVAIRLDNGQIWRQKVSSNLRLREGDIVVIKRASLGSYALTRLGSSVMMRVSRAD